MTIPLITTYAGTVPNRSQSQANFDANVNAILVYIDDELVPDLNATIAATNIATAAVTASEAEALASEQAAAASAAASAATAVAAPYSGSTTYNAPTAVTGSDGHTYRCVGTNVLGDNPVGSVTGNWVPLTIGEKYVDNEAALGTGVFEGQIAVTADDRLYTWDAGTSKWIARSGNAYTTTPAFSNVTHPIGSTAVIAGQQVRYSGSAFEEFGSPIFGKVERPWFQWGGANYLAIGHGGGYHLYGIGWVTIPMGSYAHTLTSLAASNWSYVYLDKSGFTGPATLSSGSQIYDSVTLPVFSNTKGGWYNGDDRCIFAVRGLSGSSYVIFNQNNDYVGYDDRITDVTNQAVVTTGTNHALTVPVFCLRAMATFVGLRQTADATIFTRRGGVSTTGHPVVLASTSNYPINSVSCDLDGSNQINVYSSVDGSNVTIQTDGFWMPKNV